ncbi:MAG: hypothetical protein IKC52_01100 [Clostridia bacterium]|nr:hypothetical protein [Clostridia bacterium]
MKKIKNLFSNLKSFNFGLFVSLCLLALVPAVYQTIRTFIISTSTSTGAFDVIGQMEWFDLINETLLAFLIVPLYSVLNKIFQNHNEHFGTSVFKVGLVAFALYFVFSAGVFVYGVHLIKLMNPAEIDIGLVNTYLQLETIAFVIGIVSRFVNVVFVVVGKPRNVYIFLITNAVLSVFCDFVLIPQFAVMGVALSNIVTNLILGIAGITLLVVQKLIKPTRFCKKDLAIFKEWARVGVFSGLQQFVDNIFYAVMIGKMVNMVAEQGNYWIANNFIWGWLLIPITALTEIIRRDCKDGYKNLKQSNYYLITLFVVVLWTLSIPLWNVFYQHVEQLENYQAIFEITLKLFPFYIAYALCTIPDNIFVGLGNTKYNMINSLICNLGYYGLFFVLYVTNAITMTMDVIILMFGFGNVFHLIVSLVEERYFFKKELQKLELNT